jgi:hypothetical protein
MTSATLKKAYGSGSSEAHPMAAQPSFFRLAWRKGICATGLFFVLVGGIFAVMGGTKLAAELRYQRDGVRAQGTILSKSLERAAAGKSSTRYLVTYRFVTLQGAALEASDEVDVDLWEGLNKGEPFEIVYLPRSPGTNRGVGSTEMPLALGFTGIGAFVVLVGGIVCFAGLRQASRQVSIWHSGLTAEATVLKRYVSGSERFLQYRYLDLQGKAHEYTDSSLSAEEYASWNVGDKGNIRFDPEDPGRSVWVGRVQSPG